MITIKRLKELIKDLPDNAHVYAYEGERTGIGIYTGEYSNSVNVWWIDASESKKTETHTEGFEKKENK